VIAQRLHQVGQVWLLVRFSGLRHRCVHLPPGKQGKNAHDPAIGAPAGSVSGHERAGEAGSLPW
jgi:hypothetical protein